MSTETNKSIVRRLFKEAFEQGNLAVLDEIIAPDQINGGPGALPGMPSGPEGSKMLISAYRNAFPDLHFTIDEQIAENGILFIIGVHGCGFSLFHGHEVFEIKLFACFIFSLLNAGDPDFMGAQKFPRFAIGPDLYEPGGIGHGRLPGFFRRGFIRVCQEFGIIGFILQHGLNNG